MLPFKTGDYIELLKDDNKSYLKCEIISIIDKVITLKIIQEIDYEEEFSKTAFFDNTGVLHIDI